MASKYYPADALDAQPVAQAAAPLQVAQGALDDAVNELSHQLHQLEGRLEDVLTPDSEPSGDFPQPPPAVPHCCNAVTRIQDQEDRINVLRRKVVGLLNRLEC